MTRACCAALVLTAPLVISVLLCRHAPAPEAGEAPATVPLKKTSSDPVMPLTLAVLRFLPLMTSEVVPGGKLLAVQPSNRSPFNVL